MPTAYIGLGSNIEPEGNIRKALALLSEKVLITGISTFYQTEPLDRSDQPVFYNGIARVVTEESPIDLKYFILRDIEKELGRCRSADKSAPRTIDLDILLYDDAVIRTEDINIPDPGILERPFLALPLFELEHELVLPGWERPIRVIAEQLSDRTMKPLPDFTKKLRRLIDNG